MDAVVDNGFSKMQEGGILAFIPIRTKGLAQ